MLAHLEDGQNIRESTNRALYVRNTMSVEKFTKHSQTKKKQFVAHFGRAPTTKLSNKKCYSSELQRSFSIHYPECTWRDHRPSSHVKKEDGGTESQIGDDFISNQKTDQYGKYEQIQLFFQILQEKLQNEFSGQQI